MERDPDDQKLDRLFAAARKTEFYPSKKEFGFETRVMAAIRAKREGQTSLLMWTWRLIPVLVSLVIVLGSWIYVTESRSSIDLSAVARIDNEDTVLVAFLTGE